MMFLLPESILRGIVGEWLRVEELARLDSAVCAHTFREDLMRMLSYLHIFKQSESGIMLQFPKCIISPVIGEWVDVKAVARLDSAYCVRRFRKEFLYLLANQVVSKVDIEHISGLSWLLLRRIRTRAITDDGEGDQLEETSNMASFITRSARHLQHVNFQSWSDHDTKETDSNALMHVAAQTCNTLRVLHCGATSASLLGQVVKQNQNLDRISVYLKEGSVDGFADMNLPQLTTLRVTQSPACDSSLKYALIARTECLQRLSIKAFEPPHTSAMKRCCRGIKSMSFRCMGVLQRSRVNESLPHAVRLCPLMVNLNLRNCNDLTDASVGLVARKLRHLRTLNLQGCKLLTDASLAQLAQSLHQTLTLLQLGRNPLMTRVAMDALRANCTKLHTFQYRDFVLFPHDVPGTVAARKATFIATMFDITEDYIQNSIHACDSIQELQMLGGAECCASLTPQGVIELCKKWPNLRSLVLGWAPPGRIAELSLAVPYLLVSRNRPRNEYNAMEMPI